MDFSCLLFLSAFRLDRTPETRPVATAQTGNRVGDGQLVNAGAQMPTDHQLQVITTVQ